MAGWFANADGIEFNVDEEKADDERVRTAGSGPSRATAPTCYQSWPEEGSPADILTASLRLDAVQEPEPTGTG